MDVLQRRRVSSSDGDRSQHGLNPIIGTSPALEFVLEQVRRVAPTDSSVLILGETGTGKELIAHAIHNVSTRRGGPFIKLNCAAIPYDLLESELFGHEKGAFTGAIAQKLGRFEMAHSGTLFLDEIGDIPPGLQPKLLRILQEREFERLGSGRTHRVDVRLVAATQRDLSQMVMCNEFRRDLYYRLNVFPVVVPALRERGEDIVSLLWYFVDLFGRRMGKPIHHIPQETLAAFQAHAWPGNIRELQNVVERAMILSNDGVLPNPLAPAVPEPINVHYTPRTLQEAERALISQTLQATDGVLGGHRGAAARLGVKRTTLIAKMKKLGISRPLRQSSLRPEQIPGAHESRSWRATVQ